MPYGTLALTIADGRNLKDQDLFGKMDPYVNFQLAAGANVRSKWRCKTHNGGGKNPSWNDRHNFDVVEGDDRIQCQVYDEDTASDDLIGSTSIDLNTVFARGMRDEWFPLQVSSLSCNCPFQ
jgi:Ca2+-dependent lipid-binding protein